MIEYFEKLNHRLNNGSKISRCENIASGTILFSSNLWDRWIRHHPLDELAKFGYSS
jgi:hypothetical protein